jgi:hypothetical protein
MGNIHGEDIEKVVANPSAFPARTVRYVGILLDLAKQEAIQNKVTYTWRKDCTDEEFFQDVLRNIFCNHPLIAIAKKQLAEEEQAQLEIDTRQSLVNDEVEGAIEKLKSLTLCDGLPLQSVAILGMFFKATMRDEDFELLSQDYINNCLAGNRNWSPALPAEKAVLNLSRVLPKVIEWQSYINK